jgi:hypothetical protein
MLVEIRDDNVGSFTSEGDGDGPTDAGIPAGDEDGAICRKAIADENNALTEPFQFRDLRGKSASDDVLEVASQRLGHSDAAVTNRVYRCLPVKVRPLRSGRSICHCRLYLSETGLQLVEFGGDGWNRTTDLRVMNPPL